MSSVMQRIYCGRCKRIFYGKQALMARPKFNKPRMPSHQTIDPATSQKTGEWCKATVDDIVCEDIPPAPPLPCAICDKLMHAEHFGPESGRSFGTVGYAHALMDLGRGILIPTTMGGDTRSAGVICPDCMDRIKAKRTKAVA